MTMPENEVIKMFFRKNLFGINGKIFLVISKISAFVVPCCNPALARPIARNAYSQVRMNPRKKPLAHPACKDLLDEFISMISRSKPIAMCDVKFFSVVFFLNGMPMKIHIQLLRHIIKNPHVVVAGKPVNGNSRIGKLRYFPEQAHKAAGHNGPVFKPKIEYIAQQVNF